MLKWSTTETPEPPPKESVMEYERIRLSVAQHPDGRQWQFFWLTFGEYSRNQHDECLKSWPREAIRAARQELDRFEAKLLHEEG